MKNKSVVLLSAGLDSTVNFYAALKESSVSLALTFNYGQRAAAKEIQQAQEMARRNQVPHQVVDLPWMKLLGSSALTQDAEQVPTGSRVMIDNREVSAESAKSVWVPNRNGVFLNIAAAFAESLDANWIVPGFNAEEAATFPDNSFDFIRATRKSFTYSTANHVDVQCFTIMMSKLQIVELGQQLKVPFELTWPCYLAKERWCGECESCQRARRAFSVAHVETKDLFLK